MALPAHSLAEAYLYLMVQPCANCNRGPLRPGPTTPEPAGDGGSTPVSLPAECATCGSQAVFRFLLPSTASLGTTPAGAEINPTGEPSRLLDVGQWLTLFRIITEAASRESNKTEARHLGIEAAQCLEEALRFYDDADNDLPHASAFFTQGSRDRFRDQPQLFSKSRLRQLRSKLPSLVEMRLSLERKPKKHPPNR